MPEGFFATSTWLAAKAPQSRIPKCGACGLFKSCKSPKMEPFGKGKKKILIVGEAPGREEDMKGRQFVGGGGRKLEATLRKYGVDLREDCTTTNCLICMPPKGRDPSPLEVDYCRPNLLRTIEEVKPEVIIPLGRFGIEALIPLVWKEDVGGGYRWLGWNIPCQKYNAWICPTWHPSFILSKLEQDQKRKRNSVEGMYWEHHIEKACRLEGRPWREVPDYASQVSVILDHRDAARRIRRMIEKGGTVAFDYETNMLKPDAPDARIVSCSVCWEGKETIAFPWFGKAIPAMGELLQSDLRKIASNLKFEERWTLKEFGFRVRRWLWDTMIAAHVIDNRRDITSIKFQSFVLLGAEPYDDHIKPLLHTKGDKKVNQILKEIDMKQLLTYNGLDSLLEYLVATKQMEHMKYRRPKK